MLQAGGLGRKGEDPPHSKAPQAEWLRKPLLAGVLKVLAVMTAVSNYAKFKAGHSASVLSLAVCQVGVAVPIRGAVRRTTFRLTRSEGRSLGC